MWDANNQFFSMNNLFFRWDGGGAPTPANMEALHDEVVNPWLLDATGAFWNDDVDCPLVKYRDLTLEGSYVLDLTTTGDTHGENSSPLLPSSVCAVVQFQTGLAGPGRRGRNYFAGWGENQVVGNLFDGGTGGVQVWYDKIFEDYTPGSDWTWVVASFYEGGLPRGTAQLTPVTQSVVPTARVRTQRRRLKHID